MSLHSRYQQYLAWRYFANEWLAYANKRNSTDPFILLFWYYMIFERIFKSYAKKTYGSFPIVIQSISLLLFNVLPILPEFKLNDFEHSNLTEKSTPIDLDVRRAVTTEDFVQDPRWDDITLFVQISRVRNNLFHGNKIPSGIDEALVSESWPILKKFVETVESHFDDQFNYYEKKIRDGYPRQPIQLP